MTIAAVILGLKFYLVCLTRHMTPAAKAYGEHTTLKMAIEPYYVRNVRLHTRII